MQVGFKQHSDFVNERAREWFSLMQSGSVRDEQKADFELWLASDEAHRDAYEQLEIIWRDIAILATAEEGAGLRQSTDEQELDSFFASIGKAIKGFVGKLGLVDDGFAFLPQFGLTVASVAIVIAVFSLSQTQNTDIKIYTSGLGEMKSIRLDDGSEITLAAKSRIRAWSTSDERRIVLESGQAFFVVSKDPGRPFLVDANNTQIKVVGTQFDVHLGRARTRVAVLEGIVDVRSTAESAASTLPAPKRLTAGQQITQRSETEFLAVQSITEAELGAWRSGRLIYRNAKLADVLADANRYYDGDIVLAPGVSGEMKVTATVRTDEIRFLPDMLAQSLPITVKKTPAGRVLIEAKNP
jgi:transmembrane sensor